MKEDVPFLAFVPLEVRVIQRMDAKSRACKKAVAGLRSRFQPLLFNRLWQGEEALAASFSPLYKRRFFQAVYCLAMAVLVILLGLVLDPGGTGDTFSPRELAALLGWMGLLAVFLLLGLWCALRTRRVMDDYLLTLIRQYPVKPVSFAETLFPQIVDAYLFSRNNKGSFAPEEWCGCYHCREIFQGKRLTEERENAALCPYCGRPAVLGEHRGYPIDEEFLGYMHEYWYADGWGE